FAVRGLDVCGAPRRPQLPPSGRLPAPPAARLHHCGHAAARTRPRARRPIRSRCAMVRGAGRGLTLARLAPRASALAVFAVQAQLFVEDILEGEARPPILPAHVSLHLLALLVLFKRTDRQSNPALLGIELHHQRLDLIAYLEQR